MARPNILPGKAELKKLRAKGLTYQQIGDMYGVTRSAVHLALARHDLIEQERPRYEEEIPWQIAPEHRTSYALQMLRLAARARRGDPKLSEKQRRSVASWLRRLELHDAVVGYSPDLDDGFYYVARRPGRDSGLIREPDWAHAG